MFVPLCACWSFVYALMLYNELGWHHLFMLYAHLHSVMNLGTRDIILFKLFAHLYSIMNLQLGDIICLCTMHICAQWTSVQYNEFGWHHLFFFFIYMCICILCSEFGWHHFFMIVLFLAGPIFCFGFPLSTSSFLKKKKNQCTPGGNVGMFNLVCWWWKSETICWCFFGDASCHLGFLESRVCLWRVSNVVWMFHSRCVLCVVCSCVLCAVCVVCCAKFLASWMTSDCGVSGCTNDSLMCLAVQIISTRAVLHLWDFIRLCVLS